MGFIHDLSGRSVAKTDERAGIYLPDCEDLGMIEGVLYS